jgi:hypothetical protein
MKLYSKENSHKPPRSSKPMDNKRIINLRVERQCLIHQADQTAYLSLYRDMKPGQNV